MGYPDYMRESIDKVTESRPDRVGVTYPRLTMEQAQEVPLENHPDFKEEQKRKVRVGPNRGDLANHEGAALISAEHVDAARRRALPVEEQIKDRHGSYRAALASDVTSAQKEAAPYNYWNYHTDDDKAGYG